MGPRFAVRRANGLGIRRLQEYRRKRRAPAVCCHWTSALFGCSVFSGRAGRESEQNKSLLRLCLRSTRALQRAIVANARFLLYPVMRLFSRNLFLQARRAAFSAMSVGA